MPNLSFRSVAPAALVLSALALVVGCGGGGGGGGGTSTDTTTSTTSTTASTTASTPFTTSGQLLSNTVYYVNATLSSSLDQSYDVRYVDPSGTPAGTYSASQNANIVAAAPDPSVLGRVVFAAQTGTGGFGIYRNTSLSLTGAEQLVVPSYTDVSTIQVSPDGKRAIFVASVGTAAPRLYYLFRANESLPYTLSNVDQADSASLSYDGTKVTYAKEVTASNTEIYVLTLGSTAPLRLTTNAKYDDFPQFSKNGNSVVFSESAVAGGNRDVLARVPTAGGTVTTFDPLPAEDQRYPSLNGDGTLSCFVTNAGLYVADGNFANPVLRVPISQGVFPVATYFTGMQGRGFGGLPLGLNFPRRRR